MKTHTSNFKNAIKTFGRELDSKITYTQNGTQVELGAEDLNSITPHYEGAILKSVMKQLDIDSNVEIPLGTILTYQFGVKVGNAYEYINYGNYVVYSVEKQEDTRSYKITCYDKMLYSMIDYVNLGITYPITIRSYLNTICTYLGLTFANANDQFANYDKEITRELYLSYDSETSTYSSLGYKVRDVLDELAEVTASTICINNDDELEIRYIHDVGELTSASGSSITITNGEEAELSEFEIEGNTTQETRSGRNIFKNSNDIWYGSSAGKVNYDTNTDTFTFHRDTGYDYLIGAGTLNIKSNTNYTLYLKVIENTMTSNFLNISGSTNLPFNVSISAGATGEFVYNATSIDGLNKTYDIWFYCTSTGTLKMQIMLLEGTYNLSNIPQYEQYGAMPSPDYPSELVSVGYQNLFDSNSVRLNTTWNNNPANGRSVLFIETKPNTTYTISASNWNDLFYDIVFLDHIGATSYIYESGWNNPSSVPTKTFTTTSGTNILGIHFKYQSAGSTTMTREMFENATILLTKGTQEHSYIPYGKYGIEIKTQGKNYFDENNMYNGYYEPSNFDLTSNNSYRTLIIKDLPKGTYTFSTTLTNCYILRYAINNTNTYVNIQTNTYTFTLNESGNFMLCIRKNPTSNITETFNTQIEKNTQATTYEEYKSKSQLFILNEPLRKIIGTSYKDKLYIKNGYLYVERKTGSRILNGNETWEIYSNKTHSFIYRAGILILDGQSNYYKKFTSSSQIDVIDGIYLTYTSSIIITNLNISTPSDFKTWLSTHNTEVQYILNNPYIEELGQVEMPSTYSGTTYIDASDTIDISYISEFDTIDEEYLKDVNVNFGEKFGPVNTIVLSRSADSDNVYYPSTLPANPIEIKITDNQIMNDNNRATYMPDIYAKLNGLEYYINDFSSTGVCYYDLCDRYRVSIDNNSYKCIMFNDEVNVTQGLEEQVYTDMPEETNTDFSKSDSTDRKINGAYIIADKANARIDAVTRQYDNVNGRLNKVEDIQTATSKQINVISQNVTYEYDPDTGEPISSKINSVETIKGFTFDENGLTITNNQTDYKSVQDETGTYYYDGNTITGEYTKDGSKQKDLYLFGVYYYGMKERTDTPMFVAQLYTDNNGEECFGHFYNGGN